MTETERMTIPAFSSEAEEAAWWDSHQELVEQSFLKAAAAGTLGRGRAAKQVVAGKTSGSSPTLTLRVPETDISRARALAARKGLRYQTLLQMLIHEGLEREERRAE
jgi:predicted DNA binding CopG/RHH family protein